MTSKYIAIISLLFSITLTSCVDSFSNKNPKINLTDYNQIIVTDLGISSCNPIQNMKITDKEKLAKFKKSILNGKASGLWKGACKKQIILVSKTDSLKLTCFNKAFLYKNMWYSFESEKAFENLIGE